jgi:hypothetical protein
MKWLAICRKRGVCTKVSAGTTSSGNLGFDNNHSDTFGSFTGAPWPVIAGLWTDLDTRGGATTASPGGNSTGGNRVHDDRDTANQSRTATWNDVGYHPAGTNPVNAFQSQLVGRGGGDVDIVYRHAAVGPGAATAGCAGDEQVSTEGRTSPHQLRGATAACVGPSWQQAVTGQGTPGMARIIGNDSANNLAGTAGADLIHGFDPGGPGRAVTAIDAVRVASGLGQPLFLTAAPDDPTRLCVAEKAGAIKVMNAETGAVAATTFLHLTGQVATASEQGLLGMAFRPDFATNPKV